MNITASGDYKNTEEWLKRFADKDFAQFLVKYADQGLSLLKQYTPKKTGKTAESWGYKITANGSNASIEFFNTNTIRTGTPLVILLQYGHGTGWGGYVKGIDFINPAIEPVFQQIINDIGKEFE